MKLRVYSRPNEKQTDEFGVSAPKRMQDNHAYSFDKVSGAVQIAGIDWANNYKGLKTAIDPQTAAERGLDQATNLLPAEVGSTAARSSILAHEGMFGSALIAALNAEVRKAAARIGIIPGKIDPKDWKAYLEANRAEALTGYVGHALLTRDALRVTAVGDVFVHINGIRVAGKDKPIDQLKKEMIDRIAAQMGVDRQRIHERLNPPMTLMQFELMQNNPSQGGKLAYPSIDGTETMEHEYHEQSADGVRSVLIYTDGMKPRNGTVAFTIDDLTPVNTKFNEQTALWLSDIEDRTCLTVEEL